MEEEEAESVFGNLPSVLSQTVQYPPFSTGNVDVKVKKALRRGWSIHRVHANKATDVTLMKGLTLMSNVTMFWSLVRRHHADFSLTLMMSAPYRLPPGPSVLLLTHTCCMRLACVPSMPSFVKRILQYESVLNVLSTVNGHSAITCQYKINKAKLISENVTFGVF